MNKNAGKAFFLLKKLKCLTAVVKKIIELKKETR